MGLGAHMAGGNPENGRIENDFYETEAPATHALMRFLMKIWWRDLPESERRALCVWEPACGRGAMSRVMLEYQKLVAGVISTDLIDRGYGTPRINFLDVPELPRTSKGLYDTIITNQPFDLTPEFFFHAEKLGAQRIVLLMKAQYWHSNWQKKPPTSKEIWERWAPSWWLPNTWRLQFRDSEAPPLIDKKTGKEKKPSATMDTAWCVWDRNTRHEGCLIVPLLKPIGM